MSFRSHTEVAPCTVDPDVFGAYALTHELGAGLLTRIHAVARVADGSSWTLKRLQPARADDAQARALLLAAGRALLGVSGPFLVAVREVHEQPEIHLILERVDGVDLGALLASLPARDAARFALPVLIDALHGLEVLHTLAGPKGEPAGLVHGAPHERHILVGSDGRGRVIDMTHAVGPSMPWSAGRDPRIEPRLVAPEQVLAPAHVDARADLYVLGSVLWQALTGRALSRSVGEDGSARALLQHAPPAPSEVGANCGRGLDRVCARALERTRSRRFRSAADMAAALRDEAERSMTLASPEEIAALVRSFGGRRSPEAAQLAARVTLLGVGGREPAAEGGSRRVRAAEGRPRRSTPQAMPAGTPDSTVAPTLTVAREVAAASPATAAAPTTQLEFPTPCARASTIDHPNQARKGLRWEEPTPSLPPRPRARAATAFRYALIGLALALPAAGLSLGSAVQTDGVQAVLSRSLDAVTGSRDGAGSSPLEPGAVRGPASPPAAQPPLQTPPVDVQGDHEQETSIRLVAPAQRAAMLPLAGHALPPAGTRRAAKSGALTRTTRSAAGVVASSALAQPEREVGDDDAPAAMSDEPLHEPVPANPY